MISSPHVGQMIGMASMIQRWQNVKHVCNFRLRVNRHPASDLDLFY